MRIEPVTLRTFLGSGSAPSNLAAIVSAADREELDDYSSDGIDAIYGVTEVGVNSIMRDARRFVSVEFDLDPAARNTHGRIIGPFVLAATLTPDPRSHMESIGSDRGHRFAGKSHEELLALLSKRSRDFVIYHQLKLLGGPLIRVGRYFNEENGKITEVSPAAVDSALENWGRGYPDPGSGYYPPLRDEGHSDPDSAGYLIALVRAGEGPASADEIICLGSPRRSSHILRMGEVIPMDKIKDLATRLGNLLGTRQPQPAAKPAQFSALQPAPAPASAAPARPAQPAMPAELADLEAAVQQLEAAVQPPAAQPAPVTTLKAQVDPAAAPAAEPAPAEAAATAGQFDPTVVNQLLDIIYQLVPPEGDEDPAAYTARATQVLNDLLGSLSNMEREVTKVLAEVERSTGVEIQPAPAAVDGGSQQAVATMARAIRALVPHVKRGVDADERAIKSDFAALRETYFDRMSAADWKKREPALFSRFKAGGRDREDVVADLASRRPVIENLDRPRFVDHKREDGHGAANFGREMRARAEQSGEKPPEKETAASILARRKHMTESEAMPYLRRINRAL